MLASVKHYLNGAGQSLRTLFKQTENVQMLDAMDVLGQVSILRGFTRNQLRDLAQAMHYRDYKRSEIIYYESDPALGLYIIQRGRVRLITQDEESTAHELRQVGEHEFFGELSILGEFRRIETAQAITETRLLGFFRPDLKTVIKRHPRLGAAFLHEMAHHIAIRQVELINLLGERDGKVAALQMLHGAAAQQNSYRQTPIIP